MSSQATNTALKDMRDEAAILSNFWGNPLLSGAEEAQQTPTPLERWQEITAWVSQHGGVVINEEASHVTTAANPCLQETLEEIGQLTALEADWNDESAPAINRAVILRVKKFVQWLACIAAQQHLNGDCAPAVFPTIDGGVRLYWKARGRQVSLTFHPDHDSIDVMEKPLGAATTHHEAAEDEAGAVAIEAMREAI